jgi:hypothetical protein
MGLWEQDYGVMGSKPIAMALWGTLKAICLECCTAKKKMNRCSYGLAHICAKTRTPQQLKSILKMSARPLAPTNIGPAGCDLLLVVGMYSNMGAATVPLSHI